MSTQERTAETFSRQSETLGKMQSEIMEKGLESVSNMQKEMVRACEDANRNWLERIETEKKLASEFATKLTGAKSAPDVVSAYQDLLARRVQLMTEDSQKFVTDCQKLVDTMMRSFSSGVTDAKRM